MASFADEESCYRHQEWKPGGKIVALPHPPYWLYHYTRNDPKGFASVVKRIGQANASHWCSVRTDDRGCMHYATGIPLFGSDIPMWRIELKLVLVEDATNLGVQVGQDRKSHYPPAWEYFIQQPVPLALCNVVAIP